MASVCSGSYLAITTIKFRAIFITFAASPHLSPPPSPRGHRDSSSCLYRSASSEHLRTQKGPGQHFHKQSTVCIIHTPISVPTPSQSPSFRAGTSHPTPNFQGHKPGTWRVWICKRVASSKNSQQPQPRGGRSLDLQEDSACGSQSSR